MTSLSSPVTGRDSRRLGEDLMKPKEEWTLFVEAAGECDPRWAKEVGTAEEADLQCGDGRDALHLCDGDEKPRLCALDPKGLLSRLRL